MDALMVKKVYLIVYNGALHFYNYRRFDLMTRMTFHLPPTCLAEEINEVVHDIVHGRDDYMESFTDEDLYDWKDTQNVIDFISEDV